MEGVWYSLLATRRLADLPLNGSTLRAQNQPLMLALKAFSVNATTALMKSAVCVGDDAQAHSCHRGYVVHGPLCTHCGGQGERLADVS